MLAAFIEVLVVTEHAVEHLRIHVAIKVDNFCAAKLYAFDSIWVELKTIQPDCIGDELLSSP